MLEVSSLTPSSAADNTENASCAGINEEEEEEGNRSLSGSRWPKQETLALLKIRFDMDVAFRDSGLKAPLWEEVSRRLKELGYNRSAKKCKEKFENIYKYHKRTKEGRSGQQHSKSYPFFEQLEAFENHLSTPAAATPTNPTIRCQNLTPSVDNSVPTTTEGNSTSSMSSSSEDEEEEEEEEDEGVPSKKRRKMAEFFEKLMKQVLEKQENLQRQFIEVLEKCEKNRREREEAWKIQEMARFKIERELLVQERSVAAAKDAAVLAFLQKFSDQSGIVPFPQIPILVVEKPATTIVVNHNNNNNNVHSESNLVHGIGSSRWPREEVEALIRMKTNLDFQHRESGPRGPLWEEVSLAMKKSGYDRNAKRCKEKWENINKYFKRVKESKRTRPGDSKTCPYFHQLDALYRERDKKGGNELKPEELLLHITDSSSRPNDGESEDMEEEHRDTNE